MLLPSVLSGDEDVEQFFQGKPWYLSEYRLVHPLIEALQSISKSRHSDYYNLTLVLNVQLIVLFPP